MKLKLSLLFIAIMGAGCTGTKGVTKNHEELSHLQAELDHLRNTESEDKDDDNGQIATFMTFQKEDAEEAMNFYISLFRDSKVVDVKRWGNAGPGKEGTIMHATFLLNGKLYMCSDSPPVHEWDFTPAVSNYVTCESETQLENLFEKLSENGTVMMPLNNYGFSQKFGFVADRFGISWQLNLD